MAYSEIFHLLIKFSLVYVFFNVDQRGQTKKKNTGINIYNTSFHSGKMHLICSFSTICLQISFKQKLLECFTLFFLLVLKLVSLFQVISLYKLVISQVITLNMG